MLDYRIHTFLKVCETLNYTLAAKQLHITQPAVSQHIHYLEQEYETTLFVYSNKQLSLTRSGEALRKYLMTMQNDEKNIKKEINVKVNILQKKRQGLEMSILLLLWLLHYLTTVYPNHAKHDPDFLLYNGSAINNTIHNQSQHSHQSNSVKYLA